MTTAQIQAVMIFSAILCGFLSAGYMYRTVAGLFMPGLRKALSFIAIGLVCFTFGVLLAAFIIFSGELGVAGLISPYINALSIVFYVLYIAGSVLVLVGAKRFALRPAKETVDVSLQEVR